MNRRFVIILAILALGLLFLGAGLTLAERAQGFDSLPESSLVSQSNPALSDLSFSLGNPGTNYRYRVTIGITEGPFLEDQAHFITPYGVGIDNTSLWIADADTHRALSFGNDGSFLSQIGKGGVPYAVDGTYLDWIADVTVDSQGYVWLVDNDANHVVKVNSAGEFISDIGTLGESGGDNDHFDRPRGIAFDSVGNLYISDGSNHRIQIFDSSGVYTTTIGVSGEDGIDNEHFDSPRHITIYSDTLYVADAGNHRVQIFDITDIFSPTHEATIGVTNVPSNTNGYLNWPMGVAVNDSEIYVVELLNYRVQVFDRVTLAYKTKIGAGVPSSIEGDFAFPTDVAVDSVGNIYVADPSNMRVQQFNSSLDYVRSHGTPGVPYLTDELHYYNPTGVDVFDDGSIHIVERMGKRLIKLDSNGQPLWSVGNPIGIGGGDNDSFRDPEDVSVNSLGKVFVADTGNHRIQIYDSNGSYAATIGGSLGTGNNQFNSPYGTAVDSSDYLYVADKNNERVQIFDNTYNYVATLGTTNVPGDDNSHFTSPVDVAVSENGDIYVVDQDLHRVQKYDSNRSYLYTIGVTGEAGDSHGRLRSPTAITVDSDGRVLVADDLGRRIQVFDDSGAYLTTLGGSWGSLTGQMRNVVGLASDDQNGLFIADESSHHIRVYDLGVPGWSQKNINGFGHADSGMVSSLSVYSQMLYSGLANPDSGGQLYRLDSSDSWEEITSDGFGNTENESIADLIKFNNKLYAGTLNDDGGGQIWRSSSGDKDSWEMVASGGFTSTNNSEVIQFAVYSQTIYAATFNETNGGEIWRSNTGNDGSWEIVANKGFGNTSNLAATSLVQYGDYLYAAMTNQSQGAEVWRSDTGDAISWTKVITSGGFGDSYNTQITLEVYNGLLYAGTENNTDSDNPGAELWTCQLCDGTDWIHHDSVKGFGGTANQGISSLVATENFIYALTHNEITGIEVWRSAGGAEWQQNGYAGFGDSNNTTTYWDNSAVIYDSGIYVGTVNLAQGGEIWAPLNRSFIPLVLSQ